MKFDDLRKNTSATPSRLLFAMALSWGAVLFGGALGCDRQETTGGERTRDVGSRLESEPVAVPDFSLTDQNGRAFGSKELSNKPYLATFMFTRCPSVCPRVTARMREVNAAILAAGLTLDLVSISVDPEYDTPVALAEYAKEHQADHPHWHFLTGDYRAIVKTAERGFKIGVSGKADQGKPHMGISHGSHLVLVNEKGQVVDYFRSSDPAEVSRIVEAVRKLSPN